MLILLLCMTPVVQARVGGAESPALQVAAMRDEPIQPIAPAVISNPAMVELGKKLYFDPRLSKSGLIFAM